MATAVQARPGEGTRTVERTDGDGCEGDGGLWRRALALRSGDSLAGSAGLKPCATSDRGRVSHNAPAAATTLSATPTQVVARRPTAGMMQNPAASAPSAAPAVF